MAIKLEKIREEKKKNKLVLLLKDTDEAFANTIRRLIIEEVPTLAVEDVEIKENSSALYDEVLALRLGLIPIKTDLKSYEPKEKCKCGGAGCAQCELKISLKAGKKGYVYASEAESTDPKCTFVYPMMPLVKLLARQKIDLTLTAVLGKGKEHAKWSSGTAYYRKAPVLKISKVADPQKIMQKCTDGVFTLKGTSLQVNGEKLYESQLAEYYAELDKGITLSYSDDLIFSMESWGQLSTKEMLARSADILIQKTEELEGQL